MWRLEDPQGNESGKIAYDIVPYTRGRGLDVGCGPCKTFSHFIGVDNGHHAIQFGWDIHPDVHIDSADDLSIFASQSMDFIFSSHTLEHIQDTKKTLKEWMRVIKPGGYLVLYLPHADLYPNIGEPGANPDHKHDFANGDIVEVMDQLHYGWELIVDELRDADYGKGSHKNEYSFFQVYRKRSDKKHVNLTMEPQPDKTACVVRYGAIGDIFQAASVFSGLKEQGYHTTFCCTPTGKELLEHDPNIDEFMVQDKDQVPSNELRDYWETIKKRYDKFVNLSESVEGSLLAMEGRTAWDWPHQVRHHMMNISYMEMVHSLAGVPLPSKVKFYPTDSEAIWALSQKEKLTGGEDVKTLLWVLRGSSVHKKTYYVDQVMARLLIAYPDIRIVMVGDALCEIMELGWDKEARVWGRSGKWSIRETLAFAQHCDAIIGPETGILNAMSMEEDIAKIVMMSHSTPDNLIKHWVNAHAVEPMEGEVECYPCHKMHYSFKTCNPVKFSQKWCDHYGVSTKGGLLDDGGVEVAKCSAYILPDMIYNAIIKAVWPREKMLKAVGDGDQ